MAYYDVTIVSPGGNRTSRPIVAENADAAIEVMAAEHNVTVGDPAFTFVAKERNNPELERMLREAEARRLEADYYRMPVTTRRRR